MKYLFLYCVTFLPLLPTYCRRYFIATNIPGCACRFLLAEVSVPLDGYFTYIPLYRQLKSCHASHSLVFLSHYRHCASCHDAHLCSLANSCHISSQTQLKKPHVLGL